MPDAINHLAAQNRIAKAIEDKVGALPDLATINYELERIDYGIFTLTDALNTNSAALIAAITAAKPDPTDLTTVNYELERIDYGLTVLADAVNAQGAAISSSLDNLCQCMLGGGGSGGGADLTKLIDKIDQLICVIVPIANSQHQIEKLIGHISEDGPHLGIDAPPGAFIFPKPDDTAPPSLYTPNPSPTPIDPDSGAWLEPPLIGGYQFIDPPGGMLGISDPAAYNDYKCDVATYIFRYHRAWFEAIGATPEVFGAVDFIYTAIESIVIAINYALAMPTGPQYVYSAARGGMVLQKGAQAGVLIISTPILILLALVLVSAGAVLAAINTLTNDYIAMLNTYKQDFICALHKARTIEEARENFKAVRGKSPVQISFWYDKVSDYVLSDTLLAHLFSCSNELGGTDITGLGLLEGGCVQCTLCTDMDIIMEVNLSSAANYPLPNGETRPGLVAYPILFDMGNITTDLICCVAEAQWVNGSGRIEVWVNGVKKAQAGWGAELTKSAVRILPVSPETSFTGDVTLKMFHDGATLHGGILKLYSAGYREIVP